MKRFTDLGEELSNWLQKKVPVDHDAVILEHIGLRSVERPAPGLSAWPYSKLGSTVTRYFSKNFSIAS
jgi:hypothetical protein